MATPEQVAQLRSLVNDDVQPYEFDVAAMSTFLDSADGDLRKAAGAVWTSRAGKYAKLVDVTEGSSSRKLSQLQTNALRMAAAFGADTESAGSTGNRSGTRAIVRP